MGRYKTCEICGNAFEATHNAQKYCSNECAMKSQKMHIAQWRETNKLRKKQKDKEYRDSHKEQHKEWYEAHREQQRERSKIYYQENKEKIREQQKEYAKEYRKTRRRKLQRIKENSKHRAKVNNVESDRWTPTQIFQRDNGICQICGLPVYEGDDVPKRLEPSYDHIIPMSKGGANTYDNVQLTHFFCNRHKGCDEANVDRCVNIIQEEICGMEERRRQNGKI